MNVALIVLLFAYILQISMVIHNQNYNIKNGAKVLNWKYFILNLLPAGFILSIIILVSLLWATQLKRLII